MKVLSLLAAAITTVCAQQYAGDYVNNSMPAVPNTEIAFFRIPDPAGKNNNLTLINYYSHGKNGQRIVESKIQRAVIVVHGLNRDPETYESNALSALYQLNDPNINFDSVAVIAPYFANGDDKGTGYPWTTGLPAGQGSTSNALVWPGSQWSAGGNAQYPYKSKGTISSYYVLDTLIQYFDNTTLFPNLKQIVVAGHSLGAQTVHRYAGIGKQLNTNSPVSYWIANPNSYIWFSTSRPFDTSSCSIYDVYRDGYTNFTQYPMTYATDLVAQGRPAILANYNSKQIAYARGLQDTGDDSSNCAPSTSGANRNERFFNFIKAFPPSCPSPNTTNCDTIDLINVGHDSGAMMASAAGQARLFQDNFYGNHTRAYDFGYPRVQPGDDTYPNPQLNGTLASLNNNTYAGNMTYFGCWSDQQPATLPYFAYDNSSNSIDFCTQTCSNLGYTVAGVEYGTQCFCGNALTYKTQRTVEASCNFACPANSNETCGGIGRISIFSNGQPSQLGTPMDPETIGPFYFSNCYTEATNARALASAATSSNSMTLEMCASFCGAYKYFGTEYGSQCYCGNSFSAGATVANTNDCSMTCAGNSLELCGAGNRLSVYQNPNFNGTVTTTAQTTTPSAVVGGVSSSTLSTSAATLVSGSSSSVAASPSASAASCPASNNTIVVSNGASFLVECGIDHNGGDLSSVTTTSFQGCIDACATTVGCIDFSMLGNTCYLKKTLTAAGLNNGVNGAKLVSSAVSSSSSATSTFSSSSVVVSPSAVSTSSSAIASSSTIVSSSPVVTSSLTAVTSSSVTTSSSAVISSSTTLSSTSSSLTTSTVSSSSSSAYPTTTGAPTCPGSNQTVFTAFNGATFLIECSVDHFAGNLNMVYVSSFSDCITSCANTTSCVDVSLNGQSCYQKSALGAAQSNANVWGAKLLSGATSSSSVAVSSTIVSSSTLATVSSSPVATSSSAVSSSSTLVSSSAVSSTSSATTFSSATSSSIAVSSSTTTSSSSAVVTSSSSIISSSSTLSTSSTSSASPAASSSSGFSYYGCYVDTGARVMSISNGSSSTQTPQQCALNCRGLGYQYSGTEYSKECYCSNTAPANSAPDTDCSMACSGDSTQKCGAGYRLSVVKDSNWVQTFFARQSYSTYNLVGCYADSTANRTLPSKVAIAGGASNATIANCVTACQAQGFTYCGAEYYSECYGSNTAPVAAFLGTDALASGCSYACSGNSTEACGGGAKIAVYVNNGTAS